MRFGRPSLSLSERRSQPIAQWLDQILEGRTLLRWHDDFGIHARGDCAAIFLRDVFVRYVDKREVIWLLGRLVHQPVLRNADDGAGDHGNCPVVEGREAGLCPVTDAYAFYVHRRNVGLHDELVLIGSDIENWLTLADHGADGEHPQVLNAAGHWRDDVKAAQNVLSHDKFAPQIAQLLPRINEIFAGLLPILLLLLLYL